MRDMVGIVMLIGVLIAIYLFVKNSNGTVSIINAFATNATKGIATLQGR